MGRDPRHRRGRRGELAALVLLWLKGHRLRHRNWSCAAGELDLVMSRGREVVFVEVKTRSSDAFGGAAAAVDARKRQQMVRVASVYLGRFGLWERPTRFDVVLVERGVGLLGWRLRHIRSAFRADTGRAL